MHIVPVGTQYIRMCVRVGDKISEHMQVFMSVNVSVM